MTTARKLYEFLEMRQGDYSRWCKKNITENPFAVENEDYWILSTDRENSASVRSLSNKPKTGRGNTQDFRLTANFAKKLSMQGKTERAEQAREYFIAVEDKMKEVVLNKSGVNDSVLKTPKQHTEQYQTNKVKHYTSSTPIPKIDLRMDYTKEIESSKPYELPENYMDIQKELIAIFLKQSNNQR